MSRSEAINDLITTIQTIAKAPDCETQTEAALRLFVIQDISHDDPADEACPDDGRSFVITPWHMKELEKLIDTQRHRIDITGRDCMHLVNGISAALQTLQIPDLTLRRGHHASK
jgi:hypothetical protein